MYEFSLPQGPLRETPRDGDAGNAMQHVSREIQRNVEMQATPHNAA
jgi:hypothetical protein